MYVDIRYVDVHRVSRYLSKYLTKELLMSAPRRSRRVTVSRGIQLIEKSASELKWELLRIPIGRLFECYRALVIGFLLDEEGILATFEANFATAE